MTLDPERTPVVVTAGQAVERGGPVSPLALMERAARAAFDGAPGLAARVEQISVVNVINGGGTSPATTLARRLGMTPRRAETTTIGGHTPQWLVNRAAAGIADGTGPTTTLVAGAEAVRSLREAPELADGGDGGVPDPVVGDDRPGLCSIELAARLMLPAHVYPLFESVIAARAGRTFEEHRAALGELLAPFTEVAARHRFAWFPRAATAEELARASDDNRVVAEPYTKRMNAFISVDQAAAVVVTSLAVARSLGVAEQAIFVHAGADASDVWFPVARPDLGVSPGLRLAARAATAAAGTDVGELEAFDFYSCFPSAVEMATQALGVDPGDPRGLTVTGGLPYFGGPGSNYSTHAIASMMDRLRDRGGRGLVTAIGWFVTKHSAGVYGVAPAESGFRMAETERDQATIDASAVPVVDGSEERAEATVEASTVIYDKHSGDVGAVPAVVTLDDGTRTVATAAKDELDGLAGVNLVGARVAVEGRPPTFHVLKAPEGTP